MVFALILHPILTKVHNQLAYDVEVQINNIKYIMDEIIIRDLSMIHDDMILGLRFLQYVYKQQSYMSKE